MEVGVAASKFDEMMEMMKDLGKRFDKVEGRVDALEVSLQ